MAAWYMAYLLQPTLGLGPAQPILRCNIGLRVDEALAPVLGGAELIKEEEDGERERGWD